mgnify:CR=1 FL=1
MKKILFSAYSLDVGGIETALITLLKNIHSKYEITICLEKKEGIFLQDIPKDIKIITYKPNNNKIKLIRKGINFLKQQIFKIKYKNKFDFAACYATYSYSASFVSRTASSNNALWVHNDYMSFYENDIEKYKKFFEKTKAREFKKIIFVSEHDKNIFIDNFQELKEKCIYCNNLINYKKIEQKATEPCDDFKQKSNIVTFINLWRHDEKQKRLTRIINAAKKLNQEGYIFRVIFVGDGPDNELYKKEAKDVSNIIFLGKKSNPYPYLEKSDCLLMSSDFEGYPVVFIESLILGKPIITTNVSDSKKDIKGKYGIVVEKTENGVYEGMKQYIEKGFNMEKFNPKEFNEKIIEKLEQIID